MISVVLDEKEAQFLLAVLASELANLDLKTPGYWERPPNLESTDGIELHLCVIPIMAHTQPGEDPPDRE
jgi:hypothetical protein